MRSAVVSILYEHDIHPRDVDYIMREYDELLEALERHTKMFEMFCDKVDFKHTFLDADTIAEWNEAGIQATKAIRKAKEK